MCSFSPEDQSDCLWVFFLFFQVDTTCRYSKTIGTSFSSSISDSMSIDSTIAASMSGMMSGLFTITQLTKMYQWLRYWVCQDCNPSNLIIFGSFLTTFDAKNLFGTVGSSAKIGITKMCKPSQKKQKQFPNWSQHNWTYLKKKIIYDFMIKIELCTSASFFGLFESTLSTSITTGYNWATTSEETKSEQVSIWHIAFNGSFYAHRSRKRK